MKQYVLAVDQSTTGTKAILFDRKGNIKHKCYQEHRQYYPQPGWVEHDAEELLSNVRVVIERSLRESGVGPHELASIALCNQRETILIWDQFAGKPVYHAIVWQCNRGEDICRRLSEKPGFAARVREITGLPLSPYFSAAKLAWMMEHVPGLSQLAKVGRLKCGTIDSWLAWNLTEEQAHVTDYSNASRTQLMDLRKLCWDQALLSSFSLEESMMPSIVGSDTIVGHMRLGDTLVPVSGLVGDSQGALFAQTGFERGVKITYGTGSSVMYQLGPQWKDAGQLALSVASSCCGQVNYGLEGNINSTGATLKWLKDGLELVSDMEELEQLAASVEDARGAYLVPAFTGLGAPHWDSGARAMLYGMEFGTNKAHVVRAALESIAYQVRDVVAAMEDREAIAQIRVDGKPTENRLLMQFQSDILGKELAVSRIQEASAFGAALLAGLATGFWSRKEVGMLSQPEVVYRPQMNAGRAQQLCSGWSRAVAAAMKK